MVKFSNFQTTPFHVDFLKIHTNWNSSPSFNFPFSTPNPSGPSPQCVVSHGPNPFPKSRDVPGIKNVDLVGRWDVFFLFQVFADISFAWKLSGHVGRGGKGRQLAASREDNLLVSAVAPRPWHGTRGWKLPDARSCNWEVKKFTSTC